ncbi:MAG: 50S ribosomal protein L25/general stress protein Ctc [Anaerolineales bacterium]
MENIVLKASKRTQTGKKVNAYRRAGKLPAVVYGKEIGSIPVWLDAHSTNLVLRGVGTSTFVDVDVDGQVYTTLVRERQRNPLTQLLLHVDFQAVMMNQTLRAEVPIVIEGEAPALKFGLQVLTGITSVEVESLPRNLPSEFTVDISDLKKLGDRITVADLPIPAGVEMLSDPEEIIAQVSAPEGEEITEEEGAGEEPEVIAKGKEEEEDF